MQHTVFDQESEGASQVTQLLRSEGVDETIRIPLLLAAATPPVPPTPAVRRRLIADCVVAGKPRRASLPPNADIDLQVSIAVPRRGQPHGDVDFPEIPSAEGVAELVFFF